MAPRTYVATLACGHQKLVTLPFSKLSHLSCESCLEQGKSFVKKVLACSMLTKNMPLPGASADR